MDYVRLGKTGIKVSEICLGTMQFGWRIEKEESYKVLDKAIELGINFIDTADIYSYWAEESYPGKTEEILGDWMMDRENRDELVLATKLRGPMSKEINNQGLSRRHIHQAIQGSLTRLQTDYIDIYQIHSFDPNTEIEETLHGLNLVVDSGAVNYLGASNMKAWQFLESLKVAEMQGLQPFETYQPVYNLARRAGLELEFKDIIQKYRIGVIPYSPLAGGFLTGRYRRDAETPDTPRSSGVESRYFTEQRWKILETVEEIANQHDASIVQVALKWVMLQDFITSPIIGANSVEQLEENLGAVELKLSDDEIEQLNDVSNWTEEWEQIR